MKVGDLDIEIKVLKHRTEFKALYRRLRDDRMLRSLCLCYDVDNMQDEEWWCKYFGSEERLILAGFIDKDFVGVLLVTPFGNYLSNVGEFGVVCVRKWVRDREKNKLLYRMGLKWCFDKLENCDALVSVIPEPNRHARIATEEYGARYLCTIPSYTYWADKDRHVSANLYINTKEDVMDVPEYMEN